MPSQLELLEAQIARSEAVGFPGPCRRRSQLDDDLGGVRWGGVSLPRPTRLPFTISLACDLLGEVVRHVR